MILVIDTETSTLGDDARVCEVAAVPLHPPDWRVGEGWSSLVDPGAPISPDASGVHHLTDADVRGSPTLDEALGAMHRVLPVTTCSRPPEGVPCGTPDASGWSCCGVAVGAYSAHNAAFDRRFLPGLPGPWVCTLRCAQHLWPEAPNHKNQTLRYWRGLDVDLPDGLAPHRALYDALVTAHLLADMLRGRDAAELVRLTTQPVLLAKCPLKKYKGQPWSNIVADRGYLRWILTTDMSEDIKYTAQYWLNGGTPRVTETNDRGSGEAPTGGEPPCDACGGSGRASTPTGVALCLTCGGSGRRPSPVLRLGGSGRASAPRDPRAVRLGGPTEEGL